MKRQYLGDSKDSFKWDYLDFLVDGLGYQQLQIVWMITPDDGGADGKTSPNEFPARPEVLRFCELVRCKRDFGLLTTLPAATSARYSVFQYKPQIYLTKSNRNTYFSDIVNGSDQVVFLDPDNGFEPRKLVTEKHVCFSDIDNILKILSSRSVVTVFQHNPHKKFTTNYAEIRSRLHGCNSCAIYWNALMFVNISLSQDAICRTSNLNQEYAKSRPVKINCLI